MRVGFTIARALVSALAPRFAHSRPQSPQGSSQPSSPAPSQIHDDPLQQPHAPRLPLWAARRRQQRAQAGRAHSTHPILDARSREPAREGAQPSPGRRASHTRAPRSYPRRRWLSMAPPCQRKHRKHPTCVPACIQFQIIAVLSCRRLPEPRAHRAHRKQARAAVPLRLYRRPAWRALGGTMAVNGTRRCPYRELLVIYEPSRDPHSAPAPLIGGRSGERHTNTPIHQAVLSKGPQSQTATSSRTS